MAREILSVGGVFGGELLVKIINNNLENSLDNNLNN
jgi:hypothetical protein